MEENLLRSSIAEEESSTDILSSVVSAADNSPETMKEDSPRSSVAEEQASSDIQSRPDSVSDNSQGEAVEEVVPRSPIVKEQSLFNIPPSIGYTPDKSQEMLEENFTGLSITKEQAFPDTPSSVDSARSNSQGESVEENLPSSSIAKEQASTDILSTVYSARDNSQGETVEENSFRSSSNAEGQASTDILDRYDSVPDSEGETLEEDSPNPHAKEEPEQSVDVSRETPTGPVIRDVDVLAAIFPGLSIIYQWHSLSNFQRITSSPQMSEEDAHLHRNFPEDFDPLKFKEHFFEVAIKAGRSTRQLKDDLTQLTVVTIRRGTRLEKVLQQLNISDLLAILPLVNIYGITDNPTCPTDVTLCRIRSVFPYSYFLLSRKLNHRNLGIQLPGDLRYLCFPCGASLIPLKWECLFRLWWVWFCTFCVIIRLPLPKSDRISARKTWKSQLVRPEVREKAMADIGLTEDIKRDCFSLAQWADMAREYTNITGVYTTKGPLKRIIFSGLKKKSKCGVMVES